VVKQPQVAAIYCTTTAVYKSTSSMR
jgi:hypothetical protein